MSTPRLPALPAPPAFPADGSHVEMTSSGETVPDARVVHATEEMITLSLTLADVPPAGSSVTLRWAAAPRGRYTLTADVIAADGSRVDLRFAGEPTVVQARGFVRGGGGEPIEMERSGEVEALGFVHDLSERAVRAHFTDVRVRPGDELVLRLQLGEEVAEFPARAFKVSSMRQQVPRRGPLSVEMVAVFEGRDDMPAKQVRRYIMRQQLLARRSASA
jgi:hypothetical protein